MRIQNDRHQSVLLHFGLKLNYCEKVNIDNNPSHPTMVIKVALDSNDLSMDRYGSLLQDNKSPTDLFIQMYPVEQEIVVTQPGGHRSVYLDFDTEPLAIRLLQELKDNLIDWRENNKDTDKDWPFNMSEYLRRDIFKLDFALRSYDNPRIIDA